MNTPSKALALAVLIATAATGCAAGQSQPGTAASGASTAEQAPEIVKPGFTTKGGNINVLMSSDFQTLDPGNSNYVQTANVGQLYYRNLTMAKETAGQPPTIVPDLATDTGQVSKDGLTWTFTLQKGVKFEDGSPITSADVKYGIERTFAQDVYTQAPQELNAALDAGGYKGPYKDPSADLKAVETPDARTIVFHLKKPFAEFPALASRSNTSPVPKDKDTKLDYTNHPVSTGPYMVDSYSRGKSLKLVRNPNWDPATDPNRSALPDTFTFSLSTSQATISQQLLANSDPNAITLDSNGALQTSDAAKLADAQVKDRVASGLLGCNDVLSLNTQKITDPDVRKAIALALDRQSILVQYGGRRFGELTQTPLNSKMRGYVATDLEIDPTGKPKLDEAKKLLEGKTYPKTLTYGYANNRDAYKNTGTVIQQNLKALGIDVQLVPIPAPNYYSVLASDQLPDIARSGWCGGADPASVRTSADPILGPNNDGTSYGFSNTSRYFDPQVSKAMFDLRNTTGTSEELGKQWSEEFGKALKTYPIIPLIRTHTNSVVGSNIRNAQVGYFFGGIDLSIVGVQH
ncbi:MULTISPECIES: ABC transporter substrate-binding protein [Arthrobacter]|uniref:ABC transporter substrate-binding protein n=1 Tax=Arthrobacter terricola TaxID=2547396 RepID=A0A4R5K5R2_9MICC|nr:MULTISPECIES: ABC transporter substrate-binding protein [Arthrobacter]MBT8163701.1 ABC transporter substrate-binding protein [Arthrobacter sp. GN70]TDF87532.1 ABC transporter substrate-binding protein [Arthrobacter terricola]